MNKWCQLTEILLNLLLTTVSEADSVSCVLMLIEAGRFFCLLFLALKGHAVMSSKMAIDTTVTFGPKFIDRSGETNEHGVEILRPLGKFTEGQKYVAWQCRCPLCNSEFVIASNSLTKQKTCGSCRHSSNTRTPSQKYWSVIKRNGYEVTWKTEDEFVDFCASISFRQTPSDRRALICEDPSQPVGPNNFRITKKTGTWMKSETLSYKGDWITKTAAAKLLGITRARAHQLSIEALTSRLESLNK